MGVEGWGGLAVSQLSAPSPYPFTPTPQSLLSHSDWPVLGSLSSVPGPWLPNHPGTTPYQHIQSTAAAMVTQVGTPGWVTRHKDMAASLPAQPVAQRDKNQACPPTPSIRQPKLLSKHKFSSF